MTRFDPSLLVKRVIVLRQEKSVYDEHFHEGVNIVRGDNSSGKSTILNLIFYGLGGDLADWSEVAKLCTRVILEVDLSGNVVTLRREIDTQTNAAIDIFGGDFVTSRTATYDEWKRYPHRRSSSQESFSQAIFRLLGMPEVAVEASGNITIHQILRLLYADQLSPIEELFRFERFEQSGFRDTLGRLLCGAYENRLYENEQELRKVTKDFEAARAELTSLYSILGQTDQSINLVWVAGQRLAIEERKKRLESDTDDAEKALYAGSGADQMSLRAQGEAYSDVQRLQSELGKARTERDGLVLTVADSALFITSLRNKVSSLQDASIIARRIGEVRFHSCPACYAVLDDPEEELEFACHLCKTPFDAERAKGRIAGLINETTIQIKQSEMLQVKRGERVDGLTKRLVDLEKNWRQASQRLLNLQRLPSSEARQRLRDLHREAGYLEREAEDLSQKERFIQLADGLSEKKNTLNDRINRLKTENEGLRAGQLSRLASAYSMISSEIRTLLRNDLPRQDSFVDAKDVDFNFVDNRVKVDNQTYFSASSRAILKSSFCFGFMAAAARAAFFRHPRFCMIDTLENMGVEAVRSQNFQKQIAKMSSELKARHQVIYATAMIAPDLEDEAFTIGRNATLANPTLALT